VGKLQQKVVGAIDIGGTKISAAVVDAQGRILARGDGTTCPEEGYVPAFRRIAGLLREAVARCRCEIAGIGVGSPGPFDPATGIYGDIGTLPGWQGYDLPGDLAKEFGLPVAMENDCDAAALGESAWGAGRNRGSLIYVTISTGIGGGFVVGGRLYRGAKGGHPEIGHQTIDASGPLCYCGAKGCWEVLASGPGMAAWVAEKTGNHAIDARRICELARENDPICRQAVEREAFYLGLGLANLVTMFCPDVIALGGGLTQSADLFLPGAIDIVRRICTQVPVQNTSIQLATLGKDVVLSGAAQVWHHRFDDGA
jgi:glucokinase